MDSVFERLTIFLTLAGVPLELGTIGPAAVKKWVRILRPLGTVEAIDEAGEVVVPEEV